MSEHFEPIQSIASRTIRTLAEQYFPEGTRAYCPKCGATRHAMTSELAEWFAKGYPTCRCGGKIDIETPRDKATKR